MEKLQDIRWRPTDQDIQSSRLQEYRQWLKHHQGIEAVGYEALWQWSVEQPEAFWASLIPFFDVQLHSGYTDVLSGGTMPDHIWFEGATLNYAEHVFTGMKDQHHAMIFTNETGVRRDVSVKEMWQEVSKFQTYFSGLGIGPGDRVAGYLPNIPEATFAFLAAISLGAVWSCCSQDFGVSSVVDRFAQIQPKVLVAADGYFYNGKKHDRISEISHIQIALPTLLDTLVIRYIQSENDLSPDRVRWYHDLPVSENRKPEFRSVSFSHPLWILYSSGTTGAPKAITHSHGGCLLEHLKYLAFHNDVRAGEHFFWYTTTGWMMWNFLQGSMLHGATMILYDGSPGFPSMHHLWRIASELPIHHFGTSAPFLVACMKEGIMPGREYDLSRLRSIGSTGSPLPPESFDWVYSAIHPRVWLCSMSGGTDVCTAFVGGVIEKNVIRGEIQARGLGCALYAFDDTGQPTMDEVGEMVITRPMPSMPIYFWNDPDKKKFRASYFEDIEGVWRHGDWVKVTPYGGIIIYGRSDATLNRQGVRMGTAEIYRVLHEIPEIEDGLIVNLELTGGRHYMPLFVKLHSGVTLDAPLIQKITQGLKLKCSPRHVPDDVIQVPDIPYTISGKKMEAPVKKILLGMRIDHSLNRDAMRNPESLDFFQSFQIPPTP